jgi:Distinct helicase family with a unique C-terminal domain including a metal-binding cysteine cluster
MNKSNYEEIFKEFFGFVPYKFQIEVGERILEGKFPLLIKAPTGAGKTEAVLFPFLNQFIDNKFYIAPRMIYVLPMRVLVNNVYERIKRYTQKISPYISVQIQYGDFPEGIL